MKVNSIGIILAVTGSILSVTGALINNLALDHVLAMWFWMFSNPILFGWAYGYIRGYWADGISVEALAIMYVIFTITNFYGLFVGGGWQ